MIAYAGEWHEEVPSYEESSGKSSHGKYMRSIPCEYEFILYAYMYYAYAYVMDRLYRHIHQQNESNVV